MQAQKPCPALALFLLKVSLICALTAVFKCREESHKHLQGAAQETVPPLLRRLLVQVCARDCACSEPFDSVIVPRTHSLGFTCCPAGRNRSGGTGGGAVLPYPAALTRPRIMQAPEPSLAVLGDAELVAPANAAEEGGGVLFRGRVPLGTQLGPAADNVQPSVAECREACRRRLECNAVWYCEAQASDLVMPAAGTCAAPAGQTSMPATHPAAPAPLLARMVPAERLRQRPVQPVGAGRRLPAGGAGGDAQRHGATHPAGASGRLCRRCGASARAGVLPSPAGARP